jgi:hypothetical protein
MSINPTGTVNSITFDYCIEVCTDPLTSAVEIS